MKYIPLVLVVILSGCGSSVTPFTDFYSTKDDSGLQHYRITCSGLLGGWKACSHRAAKVCEGKDVKVLGVKERGAITFMCTES